MILERLSLDQFENWLKEATDYEIKRKNYKQQRIFSYDKPNKYRSDITNFLYCLNNNKNLINNKKEVKNIILRVFEHHKLDWKS